MTFKHLFTPGKIGSLEIPNRFVQGSVQTRCADSEGFVKQELVDYHAARSHEGKGPGLVIAQQTFAWPASNWRRDWPCGTTNTLKNLPLWLRPSKREAPEPCFSSEVPAPVWQA